MISVPRVCTRVRGGGFNRNVSNIGPDNRNVSKIGFRLDPVSNRLNAYEPPPRTLVQTLGTEIITEMSAR